MNSGVRRIYVVKKPGFDTEGKFILKELTEFLGIEKLEKVRVVHRYDIEGVSEEIYRKAKETVFAEPPVDEVYDEKFEIPANARVIPVEYLPGQYDQRADSAAQCIQLLSQGKRKELRCARLLLLFGNISDEDYQEIKDYYINPLESREASLDKPEGLQMEINYPDEVDIIEDFIKMSEDELKELHLILGLAMSMDDFIFTQKYFKKEERNPTITEIRVLDTYWSDHCRHTTFLTKIKDIEFKDGDYTKAVKKAYNKYCSTREKIYTDREKDICLMDIATIGMKEMKKRGLLDDFDESEEINACSIKVKVDRDGKKEDWLVMFKNETHNHPTEIEPFGGAATCLGGAIRDPLSGRSYVYQAMRVTGSGDPRTPVEDTLEGKLPQRKITTGAAEGYSSYGNQIGLATGQVSEFYNPHFLAKRMEIGAVIAAAPEENVIRKRPEAGDVVILVGGRTGRDGCGGATGSSKKHTEESLEQCGAEVQKGNPPTERKIQRFFRKKEVSTLIKRCNDFGAGGVSVAIGELADSLDIDLDAVPKKYEGLDGTELAISESQERMAVVLDKNDVKTFIEKAEKENLEATPTAIVSDTGRLRMNWQGKTIVNLSRDFLNTHGAPQKSEVTVISPKKEDNYFNNFSYKKSDIQKDLEKIWLENLKSLNVCSQKGLVEMFDSTIGAGSVLLPFGGKYQKTPVDGMVAKIPVMDGKTNTGTIMTFGYNPELALWSPFHGAVYALVESIARSVALGGDYRRIRLTLQEYFERLGEDRVRWGKPFSALLGAYLVQTEMGIPAVGGKDSMSGSFNDLDVPPTLVSFAVNTIDLRDTVSPEFKNKDSQVILIKPDRDVYELPNFDDLKEKYTAVHNLIKKTNVKAAAAVSMGGAAAAVSRMAFGNRIGFEFNNELDLTELFLPEHGSLILELDSGIDSSELPEHLVLGKTTDSEFIDIAGKQITIEKALDNWESPLEDVFPTKTEFTSEKIELNLYTKGSSLKPAVKTAKPKVFIPVFPGTNCEYDSARKFQEAGAEVETFVFRNMNPDMIKESVVEMADKIDKSQIVMIPGGFSAGDEPEGSGKFIAAVFRNPAVKESVMRLLNNRAGLMLGICNGFQALVKLGLLPYGEIREIKEDSPTLTFNTIGRHVSCMVKTKVVSNLSPWLAKVEVGAEHIIPVSHGEGRFAADDDIIKELQQKGQIATQYIDFDGNPSLDIRFNPNGSALAVEGITDPTGRIFGKMGHSERIAPHVAKNIPGEKDQKLFKAGVEYFL